MSDSLRVVRREFLAGLGFATGALAFGFFEASAAATEPPKPATPPKTSDASAQAVLPRDGGLRPNVFVHVAPTTGLVSLVCHRSEMGQGIRSSLPVLLADELGADMAHVTIIQGDGDKRYGDQNTDGSSSIRNIYDDMRRVAATARVMLVAVAAKRWGVAASACIARDHAVFHEPTKRSLGFGALAEEAGRLPIPKPADVPFRPRAELRHVGTDLPLLDAPDIVTGKAVFGADVKVPGMLTAVIARPPVVGGKARTFDARRALAVPGVKQVVELPQPRAPYGFQARGGIAVIATDTWAALRGRAALDIAWDAGESDNVTYDSATYREGLLAGVRKPGKVMRHVGDVDAAFAGAATKLEAEYYVPHLPHAPMEPPVAVAKVVGDVVEIWAATQNPQAAQKEAATALGVPVENVTVHVTLLGGAFGRKSKADFVAEAALLAREAKAPVRVQWTRTDDLQHDYYHAVSAQRLAAGLDARGQVVSWHHRTSFPPIASTFSNTSTPTENELGQGVLDLPLAIPNVRAEAVDARAQVRIGWLRSVCNIFHAFANNSFMDEIAHARGRDPRDSMLDLLGPARIVSAADLGVAKVPNYGTPLDKHPVDVGRLRSVIERVTEISGWSDRKKNGRALGLAAHRSFLTYVAAVVSVVKDARGKIVVDEVWLVCDAGLVVNTDRVRSQMDGAIVFGTSIAYFGAVTMKNGAVEQTNFRDFRIARMAHAPRKTTIDIVKSEGRPGGIGEPGVPPIAPAIANAVFALTGTRVRELPLAKHGLV